jgi:hypothetical protein
MHRGRWRSIGDMRTGPDQPRGKTAPATGETTSVESVARELRDLFAEWRRSARTEALVPMVLGILLIPIVYFVLAFLVVTFVRMMTYGSLRTSGLLGSAPLILFAVWLVVGIVIAWRHVQPFEPLRPPPGKPYDRHVDPPLVRFDRGELELSDATSYLQLDSILALLASGPRNVLEGFAALRDLPRAGDEDFPRAAELLLRAASDGGLTERGLRRDETTVRAMAVLWSLKLIRKDGTFATAAWRIRTTDLGRDVAHV